MPRLLIAFQNCTNLFPAGLVARAPATPADVRAKVTALAASLMKTVGGPDILALSKGSRMSQLRFFNTPLSMSASPSRKVVMDLLEEFCREVENITQNKVTCALVSGFTTGLGQEFRATIHSRSKDIDHILFRAYVPVDGLPLSFDFYEDEMKRCDRVDEVSTALATFAQLDSTREALRLLSQ